MGGVGEKTLAEKGVIFFFLVALSASLLGLSLPFYPLFLPLSFPSFFSLTLIAFSLSPQSQWEIRKEDEETIGLESGV